MATVQHPTFSDVTYDVPDADASKWTKQGWKRVSSDKTDEVAESTTKKKQAKKK